ncbi:MAG: hypothetical protein WCO44_00290 [Bacteroidota bacterium]
MRKTLLYQGFSVPPLLTHLPAKTVRLQVTGYKDPVRFPFMEMEYMNCPDLTPKCPVKPFLPGPVGNETGAAAWDLCKKKTYNKAIKNRR